MNANQELHRRLARYYETEPPLRAPDWVLQTALSTIESTPQRRGLAALRRYPSMPTYVKFAAAAALVIAVGGFALWQLAPPGPGGQPTPVPTQTGNPAPPTTAPTARPAPTTYVPGALTQTFTSNLHGFSLKYPEGWAAQAATEPWRDEVPPLWTDLTGDDIYDAALQDHLVLTVVSRPLDGSSLDDWLAEYIAGCTRAAGGAIDGADQVLRASDCADAHGNELALASSGGRGYVFELRASPDDVELRTLDAGALLDAILATVQLNPENAVDG